MKTERKFVLITGASSGIGYHLANEFAKNGFSLVLVARHEQNLRKAATDLKEKYQTDVFIIQQDLLKEDAALNIYNQVKNRDIKVRILINNAGFNEVGKFVDTDLKKEIELIRINISSVIELTKLFIPEMIENKFGRIVNLGSTGSFMPVPNNAIYCAAKSFILNFSRAIRHELKTTGIKVTTLCPGATHTNFPIEAEISDLRLFNIRPMKPDKVAKIAYRKIIKGVKTIIPGLYNKFIAISPLITPPSVLNALTDWMYKPISK